MVFGSKHLVFLTFSLIFMFCLQSICLEEGDKSFFSLGKRGQGQIFVSILVVKKLLNIFPGGANFEEKSW